MGDQLPFFLREAVLSLYPAGPDGQAIAGAALWSGALATGLNFGLEYDEMEIMGSGEQYATAHHLDEKWRLQISRTWILRRGLPDFKPGRNQTYVLDLVWNETPSGFIQSWHRKTFFGVTGRSASWDSEGTKQFQHNQTWRAQRVVEDGGNTGGTIFTPLPAPNQTQAIPFFREDPLIVGDYLLGQYRWPANVQLGLVTATAWAGQGADTVLGLELDGTLTGDTLTLAQGEENTEVTGTVDLSARSIAAGRTVRWKIVSGPDNATEAAWALALTMQVTPI